VPDSDRRDGAIEIRRAGGGDAASLRRLRLRALTDAPDAFATTFEDEAARPESHWRELAAGSELGDDAAVWVAVRRELWLGMVAARWFDRERGVVQLWGMWVDASLRGRGVGERLVAEVQGWAALRNARVVRLGVLQGAPGAAGFYARLGFTPTGETRPLMRDDRITARFFSRPVS
jgi:GNAT superfamily N-acetyltransferase